MRETGDVLLVRLNETRTGEPKLRPALVLATLPDEFQTLLVCGMSTLERGIVDGWDEELSPGTEEYRAAGLRRMSYVRLSFLNALPEDDVVGRIGRVSPAFVQRLRQRLVDHLARAEPTTTG